MLSAELLQIKPSPAGFIENELPAEDIIDENESPDNIWVRCRSCLSGIALQSDKISILDAESHIFKNPAGIFYRVVCFRYAPGAVNISDYTEENTWFSGCLWSITLCRSCGNHLGWHYISGSGDFFGLIADRLTGV